jgi:hypothetical protein
VARPQSKNPLDFIISFRVDRPTADALEQVVAEEKPHHLGAKFRIQEAARLLMYEGLDARKLLAGVQKEQARLEAREVIHVSKDGRRKVRRPKKK